ncbi:hypothetical protein JK635_07405 [Neobacillus sp. YIM B02564]|uniref:Uncharacterized protein n=1 Tax=Neobacillus paridis TaxID=2803862 RepID=A0ABS1TQ63_9BACI|nr:hypothetical protein [Neobacillus paridis]MBL4952035.1 hypothetical protein [Neobacillus paridis]
MTWENVRFKDLNQGEIFRKKKDLFILEGDAGRRSRMVGFYALTKVKPDSHCIEYEADKCEHFEIEGVTYHRSSEDVENEFGEMWEPYYAIRKRDTGHMNMKVEKYSGTILKKYTKK